MEESAITHTPRLSKGNEGLIVTTKAPASVPFIRVALAAEDFCQQLYSADRQEDPDVRVRWWVCRVTKRNRGASTITTVVLKGRACPEDTHEEPAQ